MDGVWPYLFRGTSLGWPGNKTMQKIGLTPTSTDPLVATFFAMKSNQHGEGVVYYARWEDFKDRFGLPNVLEHRECEVVLSMLPIEFARLAKGYIPVQKAREILVSMGFQVPTAIADRGYLTTAINQIDRWLTREELRSFWYALIGEKQ